MTDTTKHSWTIEHEHEPGWPQVRTAISKTFWYHAVCQVCHSEMIYPDDQTPEEAMKDYGYHDNCNEIVCALVLND